MIHAVKEFRRKFLLLRCDKLHHWQSDVFAFLWLVYIKLVIIHILSSLSLPLFLFYFCPSKNRVDNRYFLIIAHMKYDDSERVTQQLVYQPNLNPKNSIFLSFLFSFFFILLLFFFYHFFFFVRFSRRINRIRSIFNGMKNSIRYGTITAELTMDNNNYSCRNEQKRKNDLDDTDKKIYFNRLNSSTINNN